MTDQGIELAVSTVIFALRPHPKTGTLTLWLPLVRRIREPYEGQWALPGGPLQPDEDLAASARHTLERTTGLTPSYLEQLYSFGALDRSPRRPRRLDRLLGAGAARRGSPRGRRRNVEWFVADELPPLAFDHNEIVDYALARLRAKITYSPIALGVRPAGVHARRAARRARSGAAQAARPRQLPPPGAGQRAPLVPTGSQLARHQPPSARAVPLPGRTPATKEPR